MADIPYKGSVTLKRKDTGKIVKLTGEGAWDPAAFDLVPGAPAPAPAPAPALAPVPTPTTTPTTTTPPPTGPAEQIYYKTPRGAYLAIKDGKVISPAGPILSQLQRGVLPSTPMSSGGVWNLAQQATPTLAPTVDPNEQIINDAANQANEIAQNIFDALPGEDVDIRDSAIIIADVMEEIGVGEAPEPPSMIDLFNQQMEALGIDVLETELADIDSQIERIQVELLVQAEEAGERLISTREIGRAKGVLQKRADRETALLNIEKGVVARQLSNKYNTLNMVMELTQQDFTNASNYYNQQFNRSIQLYNLMTRAVEREETRAEKAEMSAKVNWDIITTTMNESGISWGELTPDQQLKLSQIEIQAGLPVGFSEKILVSVNPDKTVVSKIISKDKTQIAIMYEGEEFEVFSTGLTPEPEKPTAKEKDTAEITGIEGKLIASRRGGEYVDGNVYLSERRKSTMGPAEFDKRFGDLLSPSDRVKYGLAKVTEEWQYGTATEQSKVMQWLSTQSEVTDEDYEKLKTDRNFFYYALNQAD